MNNLVITRAIFLLVFLFLKVPVYVAVLSALTTYFTGTSGMNLSIPVQKIVSGAEGSSLLAVPFLVCVDISTSYVGVIKRIMSYCEVLTTRMSGGPMQVNILLSTLMGGLSGSSLADAAMQYKMLVPIMESKGHSKSFSTVITAASGMMAPPTPPGVGPIIHGCINNISIGKLFIAEIGPKTALCVILMVSTYFLSKKRGYLLSGITKIPVSEKMVAIRPTSPPSLLLTITIGGVRIGIFVASEAGTVAIVYTVLLGLLHKKLTLKDVVQGCKETVTTTASTVLTVAVTTYSSWILAKEQIPQQSLQWVISNIHNRHVFLTTVNIFLLIVNVFIEGNVSMIVLAPLLHPVAMAYGIDDIHPAMAHILNCIMGAFTPSMGTLMFVSCDITECPIKDFIKEIAPFYVLLVIDIIVLTYIPQLATLLVSVFY